MRIGTIHRNKIWRSLVEYRQSNNLGSSPTQGEADCSNGGPTVKPSVKPSLSNASTISAHTIPDNSGSSNPTSSQGYCPGFYEVTRYTFKHNVSIKKEDHDYCHLNKK